MTRFTTPIRSTLVCIDEEELIDHRVEHRAVASDIEDGVPGLLEDEPEDEREHDPGQRISINAGDQFPPVLAVTHEVGNLVALSHPVPHDGRHPFVAQGFGPYLNSDASTLLFERISQQQRRPKRESVPGGIRQLLDILGLPAFVEGRYFDVLAANSLAYALSPNLQVGQNRLRAVFLDPAEKALYSDWDQATAWLVAGFRQSVGSDVDDPRFVQLVGELSLSSERFRRLWARHDVVSFAGAPVRLNHPQVGELMLSREKLTITEGQLLAIYHAQPGTSSAEKLGLLASLANSTARVVSEVGARTTGQSGPLGARRGATSS